MCRTGFLGWHNDCTNSGPAPKNSSTGLGKECIMKVQDIIRHKTKICYGDTSLAEAAAIMLEYDYGILPVVESMTGKLCGVITDRDICMGVLTKNLPMDSIPVRHCCSRDIHTCGVDDDLDVVHKLMRQHRIRRVPVVDELNHVVGLVSLDDLAFFSCNVSDKANKKALAETLSAIAARALSSEKAAEEG